MSKSNVIMVGCDLHDRTMLIRLAVGRGAPKQKSFSNDVLGRDLLVEYLQEEAASHQAERIIFCYEASGLGFGFCDFLHKHEIECHVLSPNLLPKTPKNKKYKTDAKDAQMLLEQLRGYVLAGNPLPAVWTPPQRLRDDRELIRARADTSSDTTRIKLQIQSMLKRIGIEKPGYYRPKWTKKYVKWLRDTAATLDATARPVLESHIDRYELYHQESLKLDKAIKQLSRTDRYKDACEILLKIPGVGLLTAMMYLTEMGDLNRFKNRREVGAYVGLCPSSSESGEVTDRKGHITRQGPARLRRMLCQAAWVSIRECEHASQEYQRLKRGNKDRTKKAIVAMMRKLAIKMWHRAKSVGVSEELRGRGGRHNPIRFDPKATGIVAAV